ncbi:MAG: hypothetical protein H6813_03620 [Phycisphaeraceae bacterium]|nr:hypothetical protein [Phycisphaeraceae bacterium]MCB9847036.1 hypothetical protein [Phycisphaeraceae bacterium]
MQSRWIKIGLAVLSLVAPPSFAEVDGAIEWVGVLRTVGEGHDQGFGSSIAIDGGLVVVGSNWDSFGRGSVYVFEQDGDEPQVLWTVAKIEPPYTQTQAHFGAYVDVHDDQIIVSSAYFGASIFRRGEGGDWVFTGRLQTGEGRLLFSWVRIEDDIAMINGLQFESGDQIGKPSLFVYQRFENEGDDWRFVRAIESPMPDEEHQFARKFDLHDGKVIIPEWSGRTAYLFGRNTGGADRWGLLAVLRLPPEVYQYEWFNGGVSIGDGVIAFGDVSAYNNDYKHTGAVHVFEQLPGAPGAWYYKQRLQPPSEGYSHHNHNIGKEVVISGRLLLVGTLRYGAYLYAKGELPGARWRLVNTIEAPAVLPGQAFGDAVALDGPTAVVGGGHSFPGDIDFYNRGIEPATAHLLRIVSVCAGDINGDNVVDTADVGALIGAIGGDSASADLDRNGVVDTADLAMLLAEFAATDCVP